VYVKNSELLEELLDLDICCVFPNLFALGCQKSHISP